MKEVESKYALTANQLVDMRDSKILELYVEALLNKRSIKPHEFENIRFIFESKFDAPFNVMGHIDSNRYSLLSFGELMNLLTSQVNAEGKITNDLSLYLINRMKIAKKVREGKMDIMRRDISGTPRRISRRRIIEELNKDYDSLEEG